MGRTVLHLLRDHPLLQPLRDAREGPEDGPLVGCHARAIWASYGFLGGGAYRLRTRIEETAWWEPLNMGRARSLADRLAAELRAEWEASGERPA